MILVMTAFRATKDSELDLSVGEEIEITNKQDEWWEGRKGNEEQGWFPASHVRELKRSQPPPMPTPLAQRPHVQRRATQDSVKSSWSDSDDPVAQASALNTTQGSLSDTIIKRPKLKLKNTSGNWRKEILGDITVMNPQELKDLNKILKSQHKAQNMNSSLGGTLRRQATISESIEEESEPEPVITVPPPIIQINVQHAPAIPEIIEEESEPEPDKDDSGNEGDSEHTLTVEKPELPRELKKKKNKEQTKNGEMPSWATKFLQSNNIKASVEGGSDGKDGDGGGGGDDQKKDGSSEDKEEATAEEQV